MAKGCPRGIAERCSRGPAFQGVTAPKAIDKTHRLELSKRAETLFQNLSFDGRHIVEELGQLVSSGRSQERAKEQNHRYFHDRRHVRMTIMS